jgi:hypothetical protein
MTTTDRPCRFCGEEVTSTKPEVDICRFCYYEGKDKQEDYSAILDELRKEHPADVEHTGGGCFWIAARLENGNVVAFTAAFQDDKGEWDTDAVLPATSAGPWSAFHYLTEDCDEVVKERTPLMGIAEARAFLASCVRDPENTIPTKEEEEG